MDNSSEINSPNQLQLLSFKISKLNLQIHLENLQVDQCLGQDLMDPTWMLFCVGGSFTFVQDFLVGRSDVEIWIGDDLDFVEENPTGPIPRRQNQH